MRKILKKTTILAITAALVLSVGVPAQAATVKINKKKVTLTEGKKTTLKVTGTKKKVVWKTSKKLVATVTKKGVVTAKKAGTATVTATVNKKKYTCKVTVKVDVEKKLQEMYSWLENDILGRGEQGKGMSAVNYYIKNGGYLEKKIDIDYTIKEFEKSLKKIGVYDKFIVGLKGEKYVDLKIEWRDLKPVLRDCSKQLQDKKPIADSYVDDSQLYKDYPCLYDFSLHYGNTIAKLEEILGIEY